MHALAACPACGLARPEPAFACPHCDAPGHAGTDGARKAVAVLFADIVGSTPLIAGKDPEDAETLLRPARELAAACVRRYGGTVNRMTGDGIMALFGAPAALEDHALAACCAAVAMQAEMGQVAPGIALRVGIHAGEVMIHAVRADGAAGLDAAGDAVHLAARLQQAAEPGRTLVSEAVIRATTGRVGLGTVTPLRLRGLAQPVAVAELVSVAPDLTRLEAAGAATLAPFVGRAEECLILAEALAEARVGRGSALAIAGEAGLGKSRLLGEFAAHAPPDTTVHQTTCRRWRAAVGFQPLQRLLRGMLVLDADTAPAESRARIEALLGGLPDAARDPDALAAVLDLPTDAAWRAADPTARRRRMIAVAAALLARLAESGPALLIVDDLHWADAETLAVLEALADRVADLPLLLLLGLRSDFEHPLVRHALLRVLPLGPLPPEEAALLAARLLPDDADAARLAARAAGNPLFIETAAAARRAGEASGTGGGAPPDTIRALLGSRIDRAAEPERRLLEAMAVHGEPARLPLLAELAEQAPTAAATAAAALAERRLAAAEGIGDATLLSCAHALIQEVVYADMTRARRRLLHGRALAMLERQSAGAVETVAETLARHARLAEDLPRLVRFARVAGRRAAARNANREAVRFYEDALDALGRMPGADAALAVDLRFEVRPPLFRLGRIGELRTRLEEAEVFALTLGDVARLGQLHVFSSHHAWLAGDNQAALAAAARAAALADRTADAALALRAVFQRGLALYGMERCGEAAACMAEVAAGAEQAALAGRYGLDRWLVVTALAYQVRALADIGRFAEAEAPLAEARARADAVANPFSMIFVDIAAGWLLYRAGRAAEAVAPLRAALEACLRAEADLMRPVAESFLGAALAASGRPMEARPHLEAGVSEAARMGFLFQQPLRERLLGPALRDASGRVV